MQIQNTNCSWKPDILQGPSLLLHKNSNPWRGGRGVAWDQLFPQINRLPFSLGILYLPLSPFPPLWINLKRKGCGGELSISLSVSWLESWTDKWSDSPLER